MRAAAVILSFGLIFGLAAPAFANDNAGASGDSQNAEKARPADNAQSRARLANRLAPKIEVRPDAQRAEREARIDWALLTKFGPASGAEPKIGEGSGVSFYRFTDKHELPVFIQQ